MPYQKRYAVAVFLRNLSCFIFFGGEWIATLQSYALPNFMEKTCFSRL